MMKKIIFLLTTLFLSVLTFSQDEEVNNFQIPDVEIQKLDGTNFMTGEIQNDGNPFIICFWKTCCNSNVKYLEALSEIYEDLQDDYDVKIFAVSIDDARSAKTVRPFVNGKDWDFDVLIDQNGDFKRSMNINNTPYTFLFNGDKNLVWQKVGYGEGDEYIIETEIEKLVSDK